MTKIWNKLIKAAEDVKKEYQVSEHFSIGGVSSAILTESGNIFVGINIDTDCSLGICAERNAIFNMLTNGEIAISKMVVLMPNGEYGLPCGACRELIFQLMGDNCKKIELLNKDSKVITFEKLIYNWW